MGTHNKLSISHFIKAAASFDRHDRLVVGNVMEEENTLSDNFTGESS